VGTGPLFVVREEYVRSLRDRVRRQTFRMRLYVVHGVGDGDSGLVEQEGTRLVLGERDVCILPEDIPENVLHENIPEDVLPEDILPEDSIP